MKHESPVTLEAQIKALAQSYKAIMTQYGQVLHARENIKEEVKVMPQTMSANDVVPTKKSQSDVQAQYNKLINEIAVLLKQVNSVA